LTLFSAGHKSRLEALVKQHPKEAKKMTIFNTLFTGSKRMAMALGK